MNINKKNKNKTYHLRRSLGETDGEALGAEGPGSAHGPLPRLSCPSSAAERAGFRWEPTSPEITANCTEHRELRHLCVL